MKSPETREKEQPGQFEFISLFAVLTSLTALSIDAMLPALPQIGSVLGAQNANDTQLVVIVMILGMVFGEMLFGPLSDAVGRKKSILIGILIYCIGTVIAMLAQSMSVMLLGRLIQGFGVSAPKIVSRALIRDQYEGEAMARILSFIFMVFIFIPMLAPAFGQLILLVADWRAIFVSFLVLAVVSAFWFALRQPETLPVERRIPLSFSSVKTTLVVLFRDYTVMGHTVAAGLFFSAFLVYLSTAQAMFADMYNEADRFPLYFALLASGIGLASLLNGKLVMRLGMFQLSAVALWCVVVAAGLLLLVSLFYRGVPPLWVFLLLCFVLFSCAGFLFGNLNALAMQSVGHIAGLAASVIGSVSSLISVIIAFGFGRLYQQNAYVLAAVFLLAGIVSLYLIYDVKRYKRRRRVPL